jgi:hypothetical protein
MEVVGYALGARDEDGLLMLLELLKRRGRLSVLETRTEHGRVDVQDMLSHLVLERKREHVKRMDRRLVREMKRDKPKDTE